MIRTKFFKKHFAITASIIISFVALGILTNFLIMKMARRSPPSPAGFYARMIGEESQENRIRKLEQIIEWNKNELPILVMLLDKNGTVLYPHERALPFSWNPKESPSNPYDKTAVGPRISENLVRLPGDPAQFLFVDFDFKKGPALPPFFFFGPLGLLLISVLIGSGVALLFLFRSLRENLARVDQIIGEIQRGNLKARFPIKRMDEIGETMSRFNRMADQIENLVVQLQNAEKARSSILQELTHDLRTPVASLKNLLETLHFKSGSLDTENKARFVKLSLKEVDYFERLVEDLLMLSQVTEPKYRANQALIVLNEILEDEAEAYATQYNTKNSGVQLLKNIDGIQFSLLGDSHLLRRMIRNALDNAFSFAKSKVLVSIVACEDQSVELSIEDDGPGMSKETRDSFGKRRMTRDLKQAEGERISIGLGSVIMKLIATLHGGQIQISNTDFPNTTGTKVTVKFPLPLPPEK